MELRHSFQNKARGVLIVQGHIVVSSNSETDVFFSTAVIQNGPHTIPYVTQRTTNETNVSLSGDVKERKRIPINSTTDIFRVGVDYSTPLITFFLRSIDGAPVTINRFRGTALFIPSHGGESVKRLTVSGGVLTQAYPPHPE